MAPMDEHQGERWKIYAIEGHNYHAWEDMTEILIQRRLIVVERQIDME